MTRHEDEEDFSVKRFPFLCKIEEVNTYINSLNYESRVDERD